MYIVQHTQEPHTLLNEAKSPCIIRVSPSPSSGHGGRTCSSFVNALFQCPAPEGPEPVYLAFESREERQQWMDTILTSSLGDLCL